jgi:hypothetical protein
MLPLISATTSFQQCMPPQSMFETMQPDVELHIDVRRPKRSRNQSLKRSVTFSNDIRVHQIRHLKDFSEVHIRATWFAPEEYKRIKNSLKATIRLMMEGELISDDDEGVCYRGLVSVYLGFPPRTINEHSCSSCILLERIHHFVGMSDKTRCSSTK